MKSLLMHIFPHALFSDVFARWESFSVVGGVYDGRDSPGITNRRHGILRLSPGDVLRTVLLLLLLLGSPVVCAGAALLRLCPGAAQGGSRRDM